MTVGGVSVLLLLCVLMPRTTISCTILLCGRMMMMMMMMMGVASGGGNNTGQLVGTGSCAARPCQASSFYFWVWCGFGVHLEFVQFGAKTPMF